MEYSVCSVWFNLVPHFFTHFSEQFSGLFWEHPWMYERLKKFLVTTGTYWLWLATALTLNG